MGGITFLRESDMIPPHPYPFLHRDLVVVADGVFTQEVKLHHKLLAVLLGVQVDVLHAQRAAAHRVCSLPLLFLVTRSQSQLVRETPQGVSLTRHPLQSP